MSMRHNGERVNLTKCLTTEMFEELENKKN